MLLLKGWLIRKFPMLVVIAFIAAAGYYISFLQQRSAVAKAQVIAANAEMAKVDGLVRAQTKSIEELLSMRLRDSESLERLAGTFSSVDRKIDNLSRSRSKLEDENDTVKNYLDSPPPAELSGLYNSAASKGAGAN